jgi:hypothetical protein
LKSVVQTKVSTTHQIQPSLATEGAVNSMPLEPLLGLRHRRMAGGSIRRRIRLQQTDAVKTRHSAR